MAFLSPALSSSSSRVRSISDFERAMIFLTEGRPSSSESDISTSSEGLFKSSRPWSGVYKAPHGSPFTGASSPSRSARVLHSAFSFVIYLFSSINGWPGFRWLPCVTNRLLIAIPLNPTLTWIFSYPSLQPLQMLQRSAVPLDLTFLRWTCRAWYITVDFKASLQPANLSCPVTRPTGERPLVAHNVGFPVRHVHSLSCYKSPAYPASTLKVILTPRRMLLAWPCFTVYFSRRCQWRLRWCLPGRVYLLYSITPRLSGGVEMLSAFVEWSFAFHIVRSLQK